MLHKSFYFLFFLLLSSCVSQVETNENSGEAKQESTAKEQNSKTDRKEEILDFTDKVDYSRIDEHARRCPIYESKDIYALANYLKIPCKTDLEKARSIYAWLTDNIVYDDQAYNTGQYGDYSIEGLLESKKSVCEGFSKLYTALGQEMGLEIEQVSGYAKGFGYRPGKSFQRSDHAWNIIKINGTWRIFDATWGQGHGKAVNGKLVSYKQFDPYWFNVDPYEAIFNHYPQDPNKTCIDQPFSLSDYERFPAIDKAYFDMGFDGFETFQSLMRQPNLQFPKCYSVKMGVDIVEAPLFNDLNIGDEVVFSIYAPDAIKIAAIDGNDNWSHFKKSDQLFRLNFLPENKGSLQISIQSNENSNKYSTILMYQVKEGIEI